MLLLAWPEYICYSFGRSFSGWGVGLSGDRGLQRQGVDRATDLLPEHLVYEAVLLDAAAPRERVGGDRRAEVVAAAGVVLDVGACAGMAASMRCLISSAVGISRPQG